MTHKITVDMHDGDAEWLEQHGKDIDDLVGLVEEMFTENPAVLLSPVFRRLLVDHARKVKRQRAAYVGLHLYVDNLCESLQEKDLRQQSKRPG